MKYMILVALAAIELASCSSRKGADAIFPTICSVSITFKFQKANTLM